MNDAFIDGPGWINLMRGAAKRLSAHVPQVNALNVFPVPDGDTGTNMQLSFAAGLREMESAFDPQIPSLAKALSHGLLMGARGNSGVILSQLFRGFAKYLQDGEITRITPRVFAAAMSQGVKTAYAAVARPSEGTILTVAREAAQAAERVANHGDVTLTMLLEQICIAARTALARTPELLLPLKQAGVVDSGGQGLVYLYEGILEALADRSFPMVSIDPSISPAYAAEEMPQAITSIAAQAEHDSFGYCTEFIVRVRSLHPEGEDALAKQVTKEFDAMGSSMLVVASDEYVKMHIHTEHPGLALEKALQYGDLIKVKIENMTEQHHQLMTDYEDAELSSDVAGNDESKSSETDSSRVQPNSAIVAVVTGDGFENLFAELGAERIVQGGDTMNPSIEDLVNAVRSTGADDVFLLPNHQNVMLTAQQLVGLVPENVIVVSSKTLPQGIAATLAFDPVRDRESNLKRMEAAIARVTSAAICRSVRDAVVDGVQVEKDAFIGLVNGQAITSRATLQETFSDVMQGLEERGMEVVTVFPGSHVSDSDRLLLEEMSASSSLSIEWCHGGQSIYDLILSAE